MTLGVLPMWKLIQRDGYSITAAVRRGLGVIEISLSDGRLAQKVTVSWLIVATVTQKLRRLSSELHDVSIPEKDVQRWDVYSPDLRDFVCVSPYPGRRVLIWTQAENSPEPMGLDGEPVILTPDVAAEMAESLDLHIARLRARKSL